MRWNQSPPGQEELNWCQWLRMNVILILRIMLGQAVNVYVLKWTKQSEANHCLGDSPMEGCILVPIHTISADKRMHSRVWTPKNI